VVIAAGLAAVFAIADGLLPVLGDDFCEAKGNAQPSVRQHESGFV
jgi:hypothetical protein